MRNAHEIGGVGIALAEQGSLPADGKLDDLVIYDGSWWRHDGVDWVQISGASSGISESDARLIADELARRAVAAHAHAVDPHGIARTVDQVRQLAAADARGVVAAHGTEVNPHRQYVTPDQAALDAAARSRAAVAAHEMATNPHRQIGDQAALRSGSDARSATAAHEMATNPHRQYPTADQAILAAQFFGG
jgi:hypothetical protein